jgi:hypothetical protein
VKDWEIIADNLKEAGWSWGLRLSRRCERATIWIVDRIAMTESASLFTRMKS